MYLYVITNKVNGKQYCGISVNYERRWREHCTGHGSKLVFYAIRKYGIENLDFTVVCKGTEAYVKEMEIRAIRMLNTKAPNGYNISEGGEGTTGVIPSEETRKKMSKAQTGRVNGPHTDATKQKMRESRAKYKRGKHPGAAKVIVNGIAYDCLQDVAEALDITYSTLCAYQRKLSSKVFDYPPEKEVFTVNGVVYSSRLEAAKALGVSNATICRICKKAGSNTFEYPDPTLQGHGKKVTINDVEYRSLKEAAEKLGVNYSTLRDARRRAESDTFTYQRGKSPKPIGGVSSPD